MTVGSLLEIYTTFFGWAFYELLWELLSATGLLYIPFIIAVYSTWKQIALSGHRKSAADANVAMGWALIPMFVVVMFAGVPLVQLDLDNLNYPKLVCADGSDESEIEEVPGGNTNTTYDSIDDFIANDATVDVPLIFYLSMAINNGSSRALIAGMSCFEDVVELDYKLRNLTLKNRSLQEEFNRFANECFVPVKSRFVTAMGDGAMADYIQAKFTDGVDDDQWDEGDPYYIGSKFYMDTEGLYVPCVDPAECGLHRFRAKAPVEGFGYDATRDADYTAEEIVAGIGRPYCDEWWESADGSGLKARLVNAAEEVEPTVGESIRDRVAKALAWSADKLGVSGWDDDDVDQIIIERLITSNGVDFTGMDDLVETSSTVTYTDSFGGGVASGALSAAVVSTVGLKATAVAGVFTGITMAKEAASFYASMYLARKAAPMVQSIIFMLIYMFLPLYLLVSCFSVRAVFMMLAALFVIRLFTPLWVAAELLDAQLFVAMFPDTSIVGSVLTLNINRLLLDIVMSVFYVVGPLILLSIISFAGVNVAFAGGQSLMGPVRSMGARFGGSAKIPMKGKK
ncbi:conjugal transfer protein TraG N-terminal domain-containing protein [Hahella ganghwensis]|uniref:conjugal transfer protein TraG N-terminal domain-containing protein n=1 Tax=Hahella ganghwensis TaxID=286420 RepID=UPI00037BF892|nr:conjugal transfer protein TraG N-terminal domain-containing protein [Hahella ganghwensis]